MSTKQGMKYITVIHKDGEVTQQVVARGQHLCGEIYVAANRMGTITSDEDIPDGDCAPVHDTAFVQGSDS
jgi:hypothetical protein